jgi:hypothetical protein
MGLFGVREGREKAVRQKRVIEVEVTIDGERQKTSITYVGALGLPSTSDGDKYMALIKIANEQRSPAGLIKNPIRFSGYRMSQELGLSKSGHFYEELNAWGQRMMNTTITSSKIVYFASKREYGNETVRIFANFKRTGRETAKGIFEEYEVTLDQWLIDNLNANYTIPQDFGAYKKLTRPIAKGLFHQIHYLFYQSKGQVVSKDYAILAALLGITPKTQRSRIEDSLGKACDELIKHSYFTKWELQPMSSKGGYKIVMWPGKAMTSSLAAGKPMLTIEGGTNKIQKVEPVKTTSLLDGLNSDKMRALEAMLDYGVAPDAAEEIAEKHEPQAIMDMLLYTQSRVAQDTAGALRNPPGLFLTDMRVGTRIPDKFLSAQKEKARQLLLQQEAVEDSAKYQRLNEYGLWKLAEAEAEVDRRYTPAELSAKIADVLAEKGTDPMYLRVGKKARESMALQVIRQDIRDKTVWPSFEEWEMNQMEARLF